MTSEALAELGQFLTAGEAKGLAMQLQHGARLNAALREVSPSREAKVRELLEAAGLDDIDLERSSAVLHAVAGAKAGGKSYTPVWTMPGNAAKAGHLTGEFGRIVDGARKSVTCATYNFEPTSQMWNHLRDAAARPGVGVTVYVDGTKADAAAVRERLGSAAVYQTAVRPDGKRYVSHAKFVIVDHEVVLLTSANFSYSAENLNVELGLLLQDADLARSIERTMASHHGTLYGPVGGL